MLYKVVMKTRRSSSVTFLGFGILSRIPRVRQGPPPDFRSGFLIKRYIKIIMVLTIFFKPQTKIIQCVIRWWDKFPKAVVNFKKLHEIYSSKKSLRKFLTYFTVSAVRTFSDSKIRFSNLLSFGKFAAIQAFCSINWNSDIWFWFCVFKQMISQVSCRESREPPRPIPDTRATCRLWRLHTPAENREW